MARLFGGASIDDVYRQTLQSLRSEVHRLAREQIVAADPDQLAAEMAAKVRFECPVVGRLEDVEYEEPPFNPDQRDVYVAVHVPFTGDDKLFHFHGHSYPILHEDFTVNPQSLTFRVRSQRHTIQDLPRHVQVIVDQINSGLSSIASHLKYFDENFRRDVAAEIRERQAQFGSYSSLLSQLQGVGFKLRRREDANESLIVPVKPKVIDVQPKPAPAKPAPEPELSLADYDEILRVIQDMVKVFERSPSVFQKMEEEHLRTILLVALNGLFKGNATGETFNGEGKTDILIRVNNNNIFIGECLIWGGPEHFRKKLTEQLFRYSTWRDSKLAAIVFNRNKNFSDVVQKMKEVASGLPNQERELPFAGETGCRHRFHRTDDPQKPFVLTCLAFDVPS
jgi:hypothetical protein